MRVVEGAMMAMSYIYPFREKLKAGYGGHPYSVVPHVEVVKVLQTTRYSSLCCHYHVKRVKERLEKAGNKLFRSLLCINMVDLLGYIYKRNNWFGISLSLLQRFQLIEE
jgi:hypothetical protein